MDDEDHHAELHCLRCDRLFKSPNKKKIRRCWRCKYQTRGILEGYPNHDNIVITKDKVKEMTHKLKDLEDLSTHEDYGIESYELSEKELKRSQIEEEDEFN